MIIWMRLWNDSCYIIEDEFNKDLDEFKSFLEDAKKLIYDVVKILL